LRVRCRSGLDGTLNLGKTTTDALADHMNSSSPILIVEDDEETSYALMGALRGSGFKVDRAGDGHAALNYLRTHVRPGLILLDWHMPVMNGLDFFEAIQGDVNWGSIPTILITADEYAKDKAVAVRASAYLKKPWSIEDLLTVVHSVLRFPT
jgi:CheY-like chemotaxis protein